MTICATCGQPLEIVPADDVCPTCNQAFVEPPPSKPELQGTLAEVELDLARAHGTDWKDI